MKVFIKRTQSNHTQSIVKEFEGEQRASQNVYQGFSGKPRSTRTFKFH